MSRNFPSGRFGYAMGYKSREAAQEAFGGVCNEGEMSPGEGMIEPYNAGASPHQHKTRYAVTVQ